MDGGMRVGIPWNGQMAISIVVMMITVLADLSKSLDCALIIISLTHSVPTLQTVQKF